MKKHISLIAQREMKREQERARRREFTRIRQESENDRIMRARRQGVLKRGNRSPDRTQSLKKPRPSTSASSDPPPERRSRPRRKRKNIPQYRDNSDDADSVSSFTDDFFDSYDNYSKKKKQWKK